VQNKQQKSSATFLPFFEKSAENYALVFCGRNVGQLATLHGDIVSIISRICLHELGVAVRDADEQLLKGAVHDGAVSG
jgi:hypothetical protein